MKADPRDFKIDVAGVTPPAASAELPTSAGRPFLSVLFKCCQVYQRVYRDADATGYSGRCPKCARPIRFVVGAGGSAGRTFVAE